MVNSEHCLDYQWFYEHLMSLENSISAHLEHYLDTIDKYYAFHTHKLDNGLLVTNINDITERKSEESDLKMSQTLSKVGHYTYYVQENYWTSSESLDTIFGINASFERTTEGWIRIIAPEDIDMMTHYLTQNVLTNHEIFNKKYRIINQYTGELRWVHGMGRLTLDSECHPVKMFGTISDITDQITIEEKLREINNTKDKLFSIISHDLKGPISHLKILTEILNTDDSLHPQEIRSMMNRISSTVTNTSNLLENLLLWAEAQRDHLKPTPGSYDLENVVVECIDLIRDQASQKSILIDYDLMSIPAVIDRDMMCFVVRNLLTNAIKFTPRGGLINVSIQKQPEKIAIHIQDNGIGMTEHQLQKLFQFENINPTLGTDHEKGTGLGLILCREFIHKNNGVLHVESEKGKRKSIYYST